MNSLEETPRGSSKRSFGGELGCGLSSACGEVEVAELGISERGPSWGRVQPEETATGGGDTGRGGGRGRVVAGCSPRLWLVKDPARVLAKPVSDDTSRSLFNEWFSGRLPRRPPLEPFFHRPVPIP